MGWTFFYLVLHIYVAFGGSISPSDDFGAKIAAATPGELFTLSAGIYGITENMAPIQIPNSIIIQGIGSSSVIQCEYSPFGILAFLATNYDLELRQVTLKNCGTAIYITNGTLTLSDTELLNNVNSPNGAGGAVIVHNSPFVLISNSIFSLNQGGYGGAMSIYDTQNFTVISSIFSSNSGGFSGGAIYISGGRFEITNSTFDQNSAGNFNGGAVCAVGTTGSFSTCTISSNIGTVNGGGVVAQNSSITILDSSLLSNQAFSGGGMFVDYQSSLSLDNVQCYSNFGQLDGGCITAQSNANTIVRNSNISHNSAASFAGGMHVSGYCFIYNCTISGNRAGGKGGGIMGDSQTSMLEIDKSVITDNTGSSGGGIFLDQIKGGLLAYNTVAGNHLDDISYMPATTNTNLTAVQVIHTEVYTSVSNQTWCCGNSSFQSPYPGDQLCSYPVCENCLNGCNCPDPLQQISSESPAYASINTTCFFKDCDAEIARSCDADASCIEFVISTSVTHNCTCNSGFYGNGTFCQEIRSCANNTCSPFASCTNLTNTYSCSCNSGYYGDGYQCDEILSCANNTCSLLASCTNLTNTYNCSCNSGYYGDGYQCDEMQSCINNTCSSFATCTNLTNTYNCSCNFGYRGNGYLCEVIDYCAEKPCGGNATCSNSIGHYSCSCNKGFSGDGYNCSEIHLCGRNPCSPFAACTNSLNAYHCACNLGYSGDGLNCTDINECENNTANNCSQFAFCQNTLGSFSCSCMPNYTGDGINCTSIPVAIVPQVTKHHNKGAIIGGVIGGLAAAALMAGLVLFLVYRNKPRHESIPSFEVTGGKQKGKFGLESLGSGYSLQNIKDNPSASNSHL